MLEAQGLCKSYGNRAVVADLSLSGRRRRDRRPARAERRRQVDDRRDALRPGRRRPRRGLRRRRARRAARADREQPGAKRRIGVVPQELSIYENLGAAANLMLFGALYGLAGALLRRARRRRRWRWSAWPTAPGTSRQHLQRRHEAAPQHRRRAGPRPRHPDLRRADRRRRPAEPQRHLRQPRGAAPARQGAALHDALHGRGRAPVRPDRHHRPRQGRRQRHAAGLYERLPAVDAALELEVDGLVDLAALGARPGIDGRRRTDGLLRAGVADLGRAAPALLSALAARGHRVTGSSSGRADLEDVFLSLTGRQLRD